MSDAIENIRKALDGATPGRWCQFHPHYAPEAVGTPFALWDTSHDISAVVDGKKTKRIATFTHADDAAYLDAVNPVAIAELLARADTAEAELDNACQNLAAEKRRNDVAEAILAALRAENERLLKECRDWKDAAFLSDNEAYSTVPIETAREELASLKVEVLTVLEPFAKAVEVHDGYPDDQPMWACAFHGVPKRILVGDLRAARDLFTKLSALTDEQRDAVKANLASANAFLEQEDGG